MQETAEPKFKIGDVVALNSNPEKSMTVKLLIMKMNFQTGIYDVFTENVKCSWFENEVLKEKEFNQDMLQLVVKD